MIKKYFNVLLLGILAGGAISLGSFGYILSVNYLNNIFGSIIFSIGLLLVCFFGLNLYTGKIGKVFDNKPNYLLDLLIMYIGNFIGALICGLLLNVFISSNQNLVTIASSVSTTKLYSNVGFLPLLISSLFCGMMVYIAVDFYKKGSNEFIKIFGLVISVTLFVLCGFSHCVANMFYLSLSKDLFNNFSNSILSILIATLGNSIGAILLDLILKLINKLSLKESKNE